MSVAANKGESFAAAVMLLGRLKDDPDVLFLAMSPPFTVRFEFESAALDRELAAAGLTEDELRREARVIQGMLLAILSKEEDDYVVHMAREHDIDDLPEEDRKSLLRKRLDMVRGAFVNEHTVRRFEVKRWSKAPSFASIDWDVKMKVADSNLTDWRRFPYATVRVTYQREFEDTPYAFLGRPFDAIQLNFSIDEVAHMVRVFLEIQDALEAAERELD